MLPPSTESPRQEPRLHLVFPAPLPFTHGTRAPSHQALQYICGPNLCRAFSPPPSLLPARLLWPLSRPRPCCHHSQLPPFPSEHYSETEVSPRHCRARSSTSPSLPRPRPVTATHMCFSLLPLPFPITSSPCCVDLSRPPRLHFLFCQ